MADKRLLPDSPVIALYFDARRIVEESGFGFEITWQSGVCLADVTERDFLRETAWVILSSGMRESVVRSKFRGISEAFCEWSSSSAITDHYEECRTRALALFGHQGKIDSIISVAMLLDADGFARVKADLEAGGVRFLNSLPFVGPVTSYHLAKNLGLDVVKPDRHLTRIADRLGYEHPVDLCEDISRSVGERLSVIDIVLWRFATLHHDYLDILHSYTGTK